MTATTSTTGILSARPLARALLGRELRPSSTALGVVAACVVAAAAFGRHLAARGLAPYTLVDPPVVSGDMLADMMLWKLGGALALPFVIAAAYLVVGRVSDDEVDGWFAPLAAGGASRGEYLLAVVAGSALVSATAHLLTAAAFAAGMATAGARGVPGPVYVALGVPPLILSAAAYGAACVAIARRRGPALALALVGVLLPAVTLTWLSAGAGVETPRMVSRMLTLHLPPWSWSARPQVVLQHAVYSVVVLVLASRLARARLGRTP